MAWKIVGLVEGRSGAVSVLPEWAVGGPNNFASQNDANTVRDAMTHHAAKEKATIRYIVLPAIDDALLSQMHQPVNVPPPNPAPPHLSFGPRREAPPAE